VKLIDFETQKLSMPSYIKFQKYKSHIRFWVL